MCRLGCGLGVAFVAAEPRVRAAVLGLGGVLASAEAAARITTPVEFLVQWDDERVPGRHGQPPAFELGSSLRFFARHLG